MHVASLGRCERDAKERRGSKYAPLIAALAALQLLCACAQVKTLESEQSDQNIAQGAKVQSVHDMPVRVIVKFRYAVSYRDPAFLQDISQQIQAHISYVASVSTDTHVYLLQPLAGHNSSDALKRLANLSTVMSVELDRIATHF